ncbi:hypothetical protein LOAG_03352 [Loa loa]|uniref:Uncharacterized protein n=1 Tax=Loa loa TaxID=7209 RepID=A0A1S0U4W1_LOALO|nr:hypothetical protein LOAG_03352 [Loa loa]EFO25133.1 hypothetical protein LOAG_03352 [Loa loa]
MFTARGSSSRRVKFMLHRVGNGSGCGLYRTGRCETTKYLIYDLSGYHNSVLWTDHSELRGLTICCKLVIISDGANRIVISATVERKYLRSSFERALLCCHGNREVITSRHIKIIVSDCRFDMTVPLIRNMAVPNTQHIAAHTVTSSKCHFGLVELWGMANLRYRLAVNLVYVLLRSS